MRHEDRERLSQPYEGLAENEQGNVARALGVECPYVDFLEREILADLRPGRPYGIAWWSPNPGTQRRILISDQLYACVQGASTNLNEAALHWLEFLDYAERESDRFAYAVQIRGDQIQVRVPRRLRPIDDVEIDMVDVHLLGTVRALAGGLDCLAGVIVAVAALPTGILRADFALTRTLLSRITDEGSVGQRAQAALGADLARLIADAGPPDWLKWLLALRNMLVHRGRRVTMSQFLPRFPVVLGADGRPAPRVRVARQLPRDPGRSDIEVFLTPEVPPVLTEDAGETLRGLIASTRKLVDATCRRLLDLWRWRRQNPELLPQPAEQWRDGVSAMADAFRGYSPGALRYEPSMLMSHPIVGQRIQAAALDDAARPGWRDFD
jgi:hypothetical protein